MSEIRFIDLSCIRCGGQLKAISNNTYQCKSCGKTFEKQIVTDVADQLRAVLNEQKQEAVANLRRQLWAEMHEENINSEKVRSLARQLKNYLPEDYFANFCEIANSEVENNSKQINAFLNKTSQANIEDYADIVLDFMIKSLRTENITALTQFIERAFAGKDGASYDKYTTWLESEADKVDKGIYDLDLPRDVFLAYSSADMDKVLEICEYLESNDISCFLALRNLRHGRNAVHNYDQALKTAIDHCKTIVFVSSTNSRNRKCDAFTKELPYIRQKDIDGAPAEFKRAYDKMPSDYMMPRVEYLVEDYTGNVAETVTKEFFHSLEWCKSKEAVAERIIKYITETHETVAQRVERENRELQLKLAELKKQAEEAERRRQEEQEAHQLEQQSRIEEERRKAKELELKIAEAEAARIEAERRAAEQRQNTSTDNAVKEDPNAKYCKKCRTANRYNAKFCSSCGSSEFFASFDEYLASKIKFCSECGAQNNVEDKFCAECGSTQFVSTKREYEALKAKREEEERQRKLREEAERKRREEEERKRREAEEEAERKRKEEEERKRVINEKKEKCAKDSSIVAGLFIGYHGSDTEVYIPDNVEKISSTAFHGNHSLKSIIIPNSVISIDGGAFWDCKSLTNITIPNCMTSISRNTFRGCRSLKSIIIPNGVTSIGEYAFEDCELLESITIPNSVTSIGEHAFYGCHSLTNITIPNSVTSIGKNAFMFCNSLTNIEVRSGNTKYKSIDGNLYSCGGKKLIQYAVGKSDTEFVIPNGVTSIGEDVFHGCNSLKSIIIPNSVNNIGKDAFDFCRSLTYIYCRAKKPVFGLPKGWDSCWLGKGEFKCKAKVIWDYKGN